MAKEDWTCGSARLALSTVSSETTAASKALDEYNRNLLRQSHRQLETINTRPSERKWEVDIHFLRAPDSRIYRQQ